jgi:exosortase/archaeosortase family protein
MDQTIPFLIGMVCITAICIHFLRREPKVLALVYLWSAGVFIAALAARPAPGELGTMAIMDLCLVIGIVFLGGGWWMHQKKEGHLFSIVGWQGFGIYWALEVPNYVSLHPDDPVNVILYAPALALFTVFSVHEYKLYKGGGDMKALRFMAGLTSTGTGVYFLFAKVAVFSTALIWATAAQTSWLYNLFGGNTSVGLPAYDPVNNEILVPILGSSISIILACTGIEAIVIFLGAFIAFEPRDEPWKNYTKVSRTIKGYMKMSSRERRVRALLYTIPPIWVLNLVRNVAILYLVDNGITSFDVAHGYAGKAFSFLVLLALAMIVFDLVPEIYDDLLDLYRLGRPPKNAQEDKGANERALKKGQEGTVGRRKKSLKNDKTEEKGESENSHLTIGKNTP